ncbi:MAG: hypothetical protein J3Q66DRAFT_350440 [Benniella sp.]|nr:MAG: hypothetical protein J3Q66DRAFT_350440 [Benniella sp.]
MLGLPELDDVICLQLTRHDLAQCARVNKKWHTVVIPYLWGDLSCLSDSTVTQRRAFTTLLLEDYLHGQQQQAQSQKDEPSTKRPAHAQPPSLSALAMYGCWIRTLPDPKGLVQLSDDSMQRAPQAFKKQTMESIELELLSHLFMRCHAAQISNLHLDYDDFEQSIAQLAIPRVRHLSVRAFYHGKRGEMWTLKRLLNRCSSMLEKLTLEIKYRYDDFLHVYGGYDNDFDDEEATQEESEVNEWTSLKELVFRPIECIGPAQPAKFWKWLFERCGQVERLDVSEFRSGFDESMVESMSTYMPRLCELTLGHVGSDGSLITEDQIALFLSGSRQGWKVVRLSEPLRFRECAMKALVKHFSTLEALEVDQCGYFTSENLVQVLSGCSRLHTFVDNDLWHYEGSTYDRTSAMKFIDYDPDTNTLKAWSCERSLKVLKIKIRDIPRLDVDGIATEEGALYTTHGLVYDRLVRFTNLETLWLGSKPDHEDLNDVSDCLAMSLESGLHKLAGLKKLKELSVSGMKTRIGVREVQWMMEHWPELRVIYGLGEDGEGKAATQWLLEHYPGIQLLRLPWVDEYMEE